MKNQIILLLLPVVFFCGCNSCTTKDHSGNQTDKDSVLAPIQQPDDDGRKNAPVYISRFEKEFLDFQVAVFNEDPETFNRFIDPERGLYIIENPGAVPKMTLVKDIRNFRREFQGHSFFTIKEQLQSCKLTEAPLPTFNCAGNSPDNAAGYSKEGCFVADAAAFRNAAFHKYAGLPEAEMKAIEATLPLVTKTVLQTSSSFKYHFGLINGQWRILFIDLMIPCSA